jgi:hypothetical protein
MTPDGIARWCAHMPSSRNFACEPPERLFHYTHLEAAAGIITAKALRLTKVGYLNDPSELEHGIAVFREVVEEHARDHRHGRFLRDIAQDLPGIQRTNVCIASFCDHGDLLSQWRSYGRAGSGVSLGFSGRVLARFAAAGLQVWRCVYAPGAQRRIMQELVRHLVQRYDEVLRSPGDHQHRLADLRRELAAVLLMVAPVMKHESFAEEREWRLISPPISPRDADYHVAISNTRVTEYYRVQFLPHQDGGYDFLDELVIGPARDAELITDAFTVLLAKQAVRCTICRASQIPFRPT